MKQTMKTFLKTIIFVSVVVSTPIVSAQDTPIKYVRYEYEGRASYGVLDGNTINELRGSIFESSEPTGRTLSLADVKLLVPTEPSKVIAIGFNYRSHLGDREPEPYPGVFAKYPSSLIATEEAIEFPEGATNVHYEGEMVLVIGKQARNVPKSRALSHVFGVTAGNDVSERDWQQNDLQWFRAKASDTFGPLGPVIVQGLNPDDLLLQTRLNGELRQSQRTSDLFFDSATIISYVSKFVTLEPGDVIYTGTPGATRAMKPGDVVEIELEGVGILRNTISASRTP
jgi:2-keto-4-pentenoate hydratase/2-oxohepta-3-ene-1,7-dioic acid hydratase in catechol pathway